MKTTYHLISFGNTNSTEYEEKVPTKEKGRRKMLAMKVAAILLMSTILVQAKPVKKREASAAPFDPFAMMVKKSISENDFNALCDLTKNLQTILTESKNEEDRKIIEKGLETLKEATHRLENFHCQVPVITTLVTEIPDATLENEEVTEIVTNPTQIEDSTEPGSLCDDCKVDHKVEDENRDEFAQGLQINIYQPNQINHVSTEDKASYQLKVIALFCIGICGIALLGLLVFTVAKMISSLF